MLSALDIQLQGFVVSSNRLSVLLRTLRPFVSFSQALLQLTSGSLDLVVAVLSSTLELLFALLESLIVFVEAFVLFADLAFKVGNKRSLRLRLGLQFVVLCFEWAQTIYFSAQCGTIGTKTPKFICAFTQRSQFFALLIMPNAKTTEFTLESLSVLIELGDALLELNNAIRWLELAGELTCS